MRPKAAFDLTMDRVHRMIQLHDVLCNTRQRGTRRDWARKFRTLMHWPQTETVHRVDGRHALLVLREASGLTVKDFTHDELGDLLRAALVTAVSALDRYCHDSLVPKAMAMLRQPEDRWTSDFRRWSVPITAVTAAIKHARARNGQNGDKRTRPMNIIRAALQDQFYCDLTLQGPREIERAFSMVGINRLWTKVGKRMKEGAENVKTRLGKIVTRRNQIVHEGDVRRVRRGGRAALNPVSRQQVEKDTRWLRALVKAMDEVLSS